MSLKLSIVSVAAATALVLLIAVFTTAAQDIELCRCTAKFEHFYDQRLLIQQQLHEEGDRSLDAYDNKDYYINDDGYYVVEGVRVLPDDDPVCVDSADDEARVGSDTTPAPAPYKRDGILAKVFGQGRSLLESDEDYDKDADRPLQLRTLMGMMGRKRMMGGKRMMSSSSHDDYYTDGMDNSKGKGKGGVMGQSGKSKGKGKGCRVMNSSPECLPNIFPCPTNPAPIQAPAVVSDFPSFVPQANTIPTNCSDGSLAPLNPDKCVSVCPESGPRPSFCADRCPNANGPCVVICETGSDSNPAGCLEACCPEILTDFPTSTPAMQITSTCQDGSVGPIDNATCIDICPEDDSLEKPFGCLNACPAGAPATGFCIRVCESGSNSIPRGCREACCPKEYCSYDGSIAPSDPSNCAVLCPDDGSFFDGCRPACPTNGSTRPSNCVDVCTGAPSDAANCEEACCFVEQPSAAPSPAPSLRPSEQPTQNPTKGPSEYPTDTPTLVPTLKTIPTIICTNDTMCSDGNICNGIEVCNVTSGVCGNGPALDCDDSNLCTTDTCDSVTGCIHTPLVCGVNEACDRITGTCEIVESIRPCVAVIDESDSFTDSDINARWLSFRTNFPNRSFCLLQPLDPSYSRIFKPTTPDFLSDPRVVFATVNRDNGNTAMASDWLAACNYTDLATSGIDFVGLFVDESGSMSRSTVQASLDKFFADLTAAGLTYCSVFNGEEDWITPFDTLLGTVGGGGACVVPPV